MIKILKGNILSFDGDAIVNTANENLLIGSGLCYDVFNAAGKDLLKEKCKEIGHCNVGEAVITSSCNLKTVTNIIHVVTPKYENDDSSGNFLYETYQNVLELAHENDFNDIAIPALGIGTNGYPIEKAAYIAMHAIMDFLNKPYSFLNISIYCSSDMEQKIFRETYEKLYNNDKNLLLDLDIKNLRIEAKFNSWILGICPKASVDTLTLTYNNISNVKKIYEYSEDNVDSWSYNIASSLYKRKFLYLCSQIISEEHNDNYFVCTDCGNESIELFNNAKSIKLLTQSDNLTYIKFLLNELIPEDKCCSTFLRGDQYYASEYNDDVKINKNDIIAIMFVKNPDIGKGLGGLIFTDWQVYYLNPLTDRPNLSGFNKIIKDIKLDLPLDEDDNFESNKITFLDKEFYVQTMWLSRIFAVRKDYAERFSQVGGFTAKGRYLSLLRYLEKTSNMPIDDIYYLFD